MPTAGQATNDGVSTDDAPALSYIRMLVGEDGDSSLSDRSLKGFVMRSLGGAAAPIWLRHFSDAPADVWFTVLPVGWVGDWHESPGPQWVCALSGAWWIETADGARVEMGPGEIHWGEDIGTRGGRGHRSGQSGDGPCVQLMVRYRETPPEMKDLDGET